MRTNYFLLGFLTSTVIFLLIGLFYVYPIYQKYQRYESAAIEMKVAALKAKSLVVDKLNDRKNKKNQK